MSHLSVNEYDEEQTRRRHGLWGLAVLVMLAVIVVSFMILFTGGHTGGSNNLGQDDSTLSGALPTPGTSSTADRSSTAPATSASSSASSSSAAPTCVGSGSCPLSGQVAGIAAGINDLRINQGLRPVPASASAAALQCALAQGNGPTCAPHYMFAGVGAPTAAAAVAALQNVNESWLLDPTITHLQIGWTRGSDGRYYCAVLKFP